MSPLLHGPIVPTLTRLAAPGIALALFQTAVSVAVTYYVGRLGTESLAVIALGLTVFGGLTGYVVYKARWARA